MKKTVLMSLVLIAFYINAYAETYTWTWTGGGGDGSYTNLANWSASPAVPQAILDDLKYPRSYGDNKSIIILNGATINTLPTTDFGVEGLVVNGGCSINNSGSARIFYVGGLTVNSGAELRIGGFTGFKLTMIGGEAIIRGTLDIAGTGSSSNAPRFEKSFNTVASVAVMSGGKIVLSGTNAQITGFNSQTLSFLPGSALEITREGGTLPPAYYQAGSTVRILRPASGNRVNLPALATNSYVGDQNVIYEGNIEINCGNSQIGQGGGINQWSLNNFTKEYTGTISMISGYVRFVGSGLNGATFGAFDVSGGTIEFWPSSAASTVTVLRNITMSGGSFNLNTLSSNPMTIDVIGDLTQTGGILDLATSDKTTTLNIQGNLDQTGGTIQESGTSGVESDWTQITFTGIGTATPQTMRLQGTLTGDALLFKVANNNKHVNLLNSVTLPFRLECATGDLNVGNHNLTVTEKAIGSRSGGSVVTNGTGSLTLKNVGNGTSGKDFPVGVSNTSHDALFVSQATDNADFSVRVSTSINPNSGLTGFTALPRQWEIISSSTGANLEFDPDPSAGTVVGVKAIAHYVGSTWEQIAAFTGSVQAYPFANNFTSFSPFIVGSSTIIPVEIVGLKAFAKKDINWVQWITATEINVSHFDIERSANGFSAWQTIGSLKAKGNPNGQTTYEYADTDPLSISYYRLRSNDLDGKTQVSKILSVNRSSTLKINQLSSMPVYTEGVFLDVQTAQGELTINLTDIFGRTLLTEKRTVLAGQNQLYLPLSHWATGTYFLSLTDGKTRVIEKLIKQ
jgi:hypothetical protein